MTKTVADLIEDLKELDPSYIVGLSTDEEGNGVNEWSGDYSLAIYRADESYGGKFQGFTYVDEETDEYQDVTEEDANAIVLWP